MNRKEFIKISALSALGLSLNPHYLFASKPIIPKISLAQWSLHKALYSGEMTTLDFPKITRDKFDLDAIEYVNQFFPDKAKDKEFIKELNLRCSDNGVKSLLIMVDNEGELSNISKEERDKAVENHKKWIEMAAELGCHSIRVNLHGAKTEEDWIEASIDSLGRLAEFGKENKINVLVENHGQWSSKGYLVAKVIQKIDNEYCGTLPDFGNFCVKRRDGDLWSSPCVEEYDKYLGVEEMMPFAKGVSAKTYNFDEEGLESDLDYKKLLNTVHQSGYQGYIGIEYEGDGLSEEDGIIKTISLIRSIYKSF